MTGSGFLGTVLAFFLAFIIPLQGVAGLVFLLAASGVSVYLSGIAETALGRKDDPRIVIDEIIGYFWSIAFLPFTTLGVRLTAFVLFRIFDVYKIPTGEVQKLKGGWGIMMDDILSGLAANFIIHVSLQILS
ncbi:MAG: hypothetical protein A2901_08085 [Elusimicrobia bacterium RIFCSPLOWO2_01_FULL_54_10]|nr:MAG: hypothetical protein A2901_08085 [Elusimicrobia bacterium RIFCSPLOWO2_01_FULL_54_10]